MSDTGAEAVSETPRLVPHSKIIVPKACTRPDANGSSSRSSHAPAAESSADARGEQAAQMGASAEPAIAPVESGPLRPLGPISPGLSNISLPLGPAPKGPVAGTASSAAKPAPEKVEEPVEAKRGDIVKLFMGRGQVQLVREDGMVEVWSMGWEMAGEQRPLYYVRRDAVKVVPTVYSSMSVLERLQIASWLKDEGARLFKGCNFSGAAVSYMKAVGVLKMCEFESNAQNARALEVMIPCHNNAATCYIKLKNFGDARLLSENVDTLCSALERNRGGMVMKALKARGVGETTILGQWWCKGLFLGGKACLFQSENDEAITCLKKGSKIAKPAALAKLRTEINTELDKATKRLASQKKKAKKMWTKAFSKNSTEVEPEASAGTGSREIPPQQLNGGPHTSVLQRLEELSRMGSVKSPAKPEPTKVIEEAEEESEEEESEYESDDEAQASASSSKGLLWGTLAVGVAAASVAALVVLRKRH